MKKFAAVCLALVMALGLTVPAFAAEEPDVGIIGGADGPTDIRVTAITPQTPAQEEIDAYLAGRGGTPGQINVMVDGKCVPFTGVFPTIVSGRTMVPLRGVLEFLGAQVEYDSATRTARVTGKDIAFTHVIGTDRIALGDGGESLTMDVASVVQGGSTLVPLRFFSQTLGYDVFWDKDYRTAVVIDKAAFIESFDKDFTVLNSYMARQYKNLDMTGPISEDLTIDADVKVIDSINGDQTYKISGNVALAVGQETIGISGRLELGDLAKLWDAAVQPSAGQTAGGEMAGALSPLTFDLVMAADQVYVKSPLVSYILRSTGYAVPEGEVWFAVEAQGLAELLAQYTQMLGKMETMTFGQVLYELFAIVGVEDSAVLYDMMTQMAQLYRQMMGDSTWTRSGADYKWHFGETEFEKLMETMTGEKTSLSEAGITRYTIDMTLGQGGSVDMAMDMAGQGMQLTMQGSGSAGKADFTGSFRLQNICDVTFRMDAAVKSGGQVPTVPAGAQVLREADLQPAA